MVLQMVSYFILSVSSSFSSISHESKWSEQYEMKILLLRKRRFHVALLLAHIACSVYAYIAKLQRLITERKM